MREWFIKLGIFHTKIPPRVPKLNLSENNIRDIKVAIRCSLIASGCPVTCWDSAAKHISDVRKATDKRSNNYISPYERLYNGKFTPLSLPIFGQVFYIKLNEANKNTFHPMTTKMLFMCVEYDYLPHGKVFKFFNPMSRKYIRTTDYLWPDKLEFYYKPHPDDFTFDIDSDDESDYEEENDPHKPQRVNDIFDNINNDDYNKIQHDQLSSDEEEESDDENIVLNMQDITCNNDNPDFMNVILQHSIYNANDTMSQLINDDMKKTLPFVKDKY